MKKLPILLLALTLTLMSCGGNWEKKAELDIGFPFTIAGFISDDYGFTAGMFGEIHATNNGGKEWATIPEFNDKYAIDALESGLFIHAGFGGLIAKFADGGTSTRLETPLSGAVMLVSFLDERHGCAVTKSNDIRITSDFGKTWHGVPKPPTMGKLLAIDLFSPDGVCVLDAAGDLYSTMDGGASWNRTTLAIQKYSMDFKCLSSSSASMRFTDADTGTLAIIAPNPASPAGFVLMCTTLDGGTTVAAEKIPCELNAGTKLFLSPDALYLTVSNEKKITLFRHH